ncbi:MAG: serpin family protein [Chloroflexi bacterium]|nr:serpin family protein [Chloroflexota bacterium]
MRAKYLFATAAISLFAVVGISCSSNEPFSIPTRQPTVTPTTGPQNFTVAFSTRNRIQTPNITTDDLERQVDGNDEFALELYRQLATDNTGNLFMSPYSVSAALAMTYAGARGNTATEMADTLHFNLRDRQLHTAFNQLDQLLAARGSDLPPDQKFTLNIANSIWGQQGFKFESAFLDTLAENYGAGMRLVDYSTQAEFARQTINEWVEDNTNGRIKDLIPQGALDEQTVLVLANAIYFKAAWAREFNADLTARGDFHTLKDGTVKADMMHQTDMFNFADADGYTAIEIPYVGQETSMIVLVPDEGKFTSFESSLDAAKLARVMNDMRYTNVDLKFPKFSYESKFMLPRVLKQLGMLDAFDPFEADFSGMRTPPPSLLITDVIHQAFVAVDEQGTEAAAATAVIISNTSISLDPVELTVNRPFIYLIRDVPTNTILFTGRVLNPAD